MQLAASPCSPAVVTTCDCLVSGSDIDYTSFNNNDYCGGGSVAQMHRYKHERHTQKKMANKALFMEAAWGSPTKTPTALSPLAVPSTTPWAYREYQLFCCDLVALPTTAAAKEREGRPGQPKIDTIFKKSSNTFRSSL